MKTFDAPLTVRKASAPRPADRFAPRSAVGRPGRLSRVARVALDNSAEAPLPVRVVAKSISDWVNRLGRVWVEGQVTQLSRRPGTVFLTLRDPVADVSVTVQK